MAIENVRYRTPDECREALWRMGSRDPEDYRTVAHEGAHFNKAVELGYSPVCGIRMSVDRPPIVICGFVDFEGPVPEGQDMIDILMAPNPPGQITITRS